VANPEQSSFNSTISPIRHLTI